MTLVIGVGETIEIIIDSKHPFVMHQDLGGRPSMIHSCIRASNGFILVWGSQSRQRSIKSIKEGEVHPMTYLKGLVPGILSFPRESVVTSNGSSVSSSKNIFDLVDWSSICSDGSPLTSIISDSYSCSFSPGKIGYPVNNSTRMHPKLHISIAGV